METPTMGKVLVTAKIENLEDLTASEKGLLPDDQVRRIEVQDAVIDTGATTLLLPKRMIAALGSEAPPDAPLARSGRRIPCRMLRHRAADNPGSRLSLWTSGRSAMNTQSWLARSLWNRSTGSSTPRDNG